MSDFFNSMADIDKWAKSKRGQQCVINEANVKAILKDAGKRLKQLMINELEKYYESYEPTVYIRTGYTVQSIHVGEPKKISYNKWGLAITFDERLANHPSYIDQNQPDGYTPWLLEVGWSISDKVGFYKPMFTEHAGTHFISHAIDKFNKNNPYNLKVTVYHDGKRYYP